MRNLRGAFAQVRAKRDKLRSPPKTNTRFEGARGNPSLRPDQFGEFLQVDIAAGDHADDRPFERRIA